MYRNDRKKLFQSGEMSGVEQLFNFTYFVIVYSDGDRVGLRGPSGEIQRGSDKTPM